MTVNSLTEIDSVLRPPYLLTPVLSVSIPKFIN
jgi:hypothetical protein